MEISDAEKSKFFDAIESLKKYRRADLLDDKGRSLLKELYTDLLPGDHILNKSLKDNTTFLIGRKGTGKSTIFLRIEQELRQNPGFLPCYLDVKTIYESAQTEHLNLAHLSDYLTAKSLKKYLIERSFLQNVLSRIIDEVNTRYNTTFEKLKGILGETKAQSIGKKLAELKKRIEDNDILNEIEIPSIKAISTKQKTFDEDTQTSSTSSVASIGFEVKKDPSINAKVEGSDGLQNSDKTSVEFEESFTNVFLQVFQIKNYIAEIKSVLKEIDVKHVVLLLDDFSEIDDNAMRVFVDVILAPLNNWSEEFIKLKVAAYPNRIYFGKIDPGKIDEINLDFYNLYSEFDRNKMEEGAVDFTKRLIEKRIKYFVNVAPETFFDTGRTTMDEYYELLFQTSMNVPRIIGYILAYCYQSRIIYNKRITKQDIENASQRYYEDKIEVFFRKTTYSLMSLDEKIDSLQLEDLLDKLVEKMAEIKRKISGRVSANEEFVPDTPYASHFYFAPALEEFLKTLELNFFISKYAEMTNRDGELSSIYCLNYGLTRKNNLLWGKPKGTKYRKYFIIRNFNFNPLIKDFLLSSKRIYCSSSDCGKTFTHEEIPLLEFSNYKCNVCGAQVLIEQTSESIRGKIDKIKESDLLTPSEVEIIMDLVKTDAPKTAREIAEDADLSKQFVAQNGRKLDIGKGLIKREKENDEVYSYDLTDAARKIYGKSD